MMIDRRLVGLVPEGSIVGITGRSGSGKSTLLKLFMRFWEPDAGAVEVSGRDVSDIDTADLRAFARERAGRTVLLVSHRASTMRIADTVVSIEDGRAS